MKIEGQRMSSGCIDEWNVMDIVHKSACGTWYGFLKTSGMLSMKTMSHSRRANSVEKVEPSPWMPGATANNG